MIIHIMISILYAFVCQKALTHKPFQRLFCKQKSDLKQKF